jgi:hypothetical protein
METKIASSSTIEGLTNLINQYFYSDTYRIEVENGLFVMYNRLGLYSNGYVIKKGKKFIFSQYK